MEQGDVGQQANGHAAQFVPRPLVIRADHPRRIHRWADHLVGYIHDHAVYALEEDRDRVMEERDAAIQDREEALQAQAALTVQQADLRDRADLVPGLLHTISGLHDRVAELEMRYWTVRGQLDGQRETERLHLQAISSLRSSVAVLREQSERERDLIRRELEEMSQFFHRQLSDLGASARGMVSGISSTLMVGKDMFTAFRARLQPDIPEGSRTRGTDQEGAGPSGVGASEGSETEEDPSEDSAAVPRDGTGSQA